jgi:fumarate reductase subunit C
MMNRKPYIRKIHKYWWLNQPRYTIYMVRELTCIFIGAYTLVILVGLFRLSQGPSAYGAFVDLLQSPLAIGFHILAFVFALVHTVSWFGLTPKAMPLRFGQKTVPGAAIIAAHYAVWLMVSAGLLFMARI